MAAKKSPHRWSKHVTETSDALDLKPHVFESRDPKAIARSLKASAEHSERPQERSVPLGDVDADLLHQPRRTQPSGDAEEAPRSGEGRAARAVPSPAGQATRGLIAARRAVRRSTSGAALRRARPRSFDSDGVLQPFRPHAFQNGGSPCFQLERRRLECTSSSSPTCAGTSSSNARSTCCRGWPRHYHVVFVEEPMHDRRRGRISSASTPRARRRGAAPAHAGRRPRLPRRPAARCCSRCSPSYLAEHAHRRLRRLVLHADGAAAARPTWRRARSSTTAWTSCRRSRARRARCGSARPRC